MHERFPRPFRIQSSSNKDRGEDDKFNEKSLPPNATLTASVKDQLGRLNGHNDWRNIGKAILAQKGTGKKGAPSSLPRTATIKRKEHPMPFNVTDIGRIPGPYANRPISAEPQGEAPQTLRPKMPTDELHTLRPRRPQETLRELASKARDLASVEGTVKKSADPTVGEKFGKEVEEAANRAVALAMKTMENFYGGQWTPELAAKVEDILTKHAKEALESIEKLPLNEDLAKTVSKTFQKAMDAAADEIKQLPEFVENDPHGYAANQASANSSIEICNGIDRIQQAEKNETNNA